MRYRKFVLPLLISGLEVQIHDGSLAELMILIEKHCANCVQMQDIKHNSPLLSPTSTQAYNNPP